MIIKLYDIQDEITVRGSMEGSRLKRPEDKDLSFLSPIDYEIAATKTGDSVWLSGPVRAKLSLTCARCLEGFTLDVDARLNIELMPKETEPHSPEVELKNDEMDTYFYEGDEIEIDPFIFEEVMLNLPIKALCSDACKGMCPSCGKNLNLEACRCDKIGATALGQQLRSFLKEH
jgi:uncharacterized protein